LTRRPGFFLDRVGRLSGRRVAPTRKDVRAELTPNTRFTPSAGETICVSLRQHLPRTIVGLVKALNSFPKTTMKTLTRRQFIRAGTVALGLPSLIPARILGAEAPSKQITVGFIGTGGHGTGWNLRAYLKQPDARVLAVCDVDSSHLRSAKEMVDQHYGNHDCAAFKDFRELLNRRDIDAVMISTPDHWHTLISVMAVRAGKDVQCEKPTLTIDEGKVLIETVRRHHKVFQTSTEDRSLPMYHRMAELVRSGRIGKLQRIDVILPRQPTVPGDPTPQRVPPELDWEMWLGPAPAAPYTKDRAHFNFRWIWDYSGGIICDWGTHLFDTAQWANDTERSGPIEVEGSGTFWEGGLYDTVKDYDVTYRYANGVIMTCKPGNPSIKFTGTEGWVGNRGWRGEVEASSPEILHSKIGSDEIHLYTNPAGEHRDFLDCVKTRKDPYFPVDVGHRVSSVCHLANIAIKLGRKLKWDPQAERFQNDDAANAMLSRPMRSPWRLA
jgi:predicted dehydrogenase